MVIQKAIQTHEETFDKFRLVKLKYSVKVEKQLSDNDFVLELIYCLAKQEKIKLA